MSKIINSLLEKIRFTDQLLTESKKNKYSERIDINQTDWMEKAKLQSEKFISEHKDSISSISKDLIFNFEKLSLKERNQILNELSNSNYLKDYLDIFNPEEKTFRNSLLLLLLRNLESDSRDILLEINELIKKAKNNNIDYKKVLSELIPIADNTDKHGLGSMKDILMKIE